MPHRPPSPLVCSLALALAAACSRTNPDTSKPDITVDDPPPVDLAASATPGDVAAPPERQTTDDEKFGVLAAINDGAIDQAELAAVRSHDPHVKQFAADMIRDHNDLQERQKMTRDRIGLRATDSRLGDDIEDVSDQKVKTLNDTPRGDPFDSTFVAVQVENYTAWIDFIDNKLLPAAQTPDLRQELTEARARFEARLSQARALQSMLTRPRT